MMKKIVVVVISICLSLGFANHCVVGKDNDNVVNHRINRAFEPNEKPLNKKPSLNEQDSLNVFNSFECVYPDPVSNLRSEEMHFFSVTWNVSNPSGFSKFRAYAKFKVFDIAQMVIGGDPLSLSHKVLNVVLMPSDNADYILGVTPGYFLYSCSDGEELVCSSQLVGFSEAINKQLVATYGGDPEDFSWESATFLGIFFKMQGFQSEVCGLYEQDTLDESNAVDPTSDPEDQPIQRATLLKRNYLPAWIP
ncbi:hypothetical protein ACFL0S_04330 [Thermodesulfobacteriota bacterium]